MPEVPPTKTATRGGREEREALWARTASRVGMVA
jgi:hypothetical protein